jgi:hypothetical protein
VLDMCYKREVEEMSRSLELNKVQWVVFRTATHRTASVHFL